MARRVGFARASEHINAHVGSKELLTLFTEGDALVTMTAFDGLELAAVSAGGHNIRSGGLQILRVRGRRLFALHVCRCKVHGVPVHLVLDGALLAQPV